jgi:hypothetical protein
MIPIDQILTILADSPRRIAAAAANIAPDRLHTPPGPGEWPANEVLAHLRACADVWGKYMALILAEDVPVIRAVSPRTYIHKTDYPKQEFQASLQAFSEQRAALLEVLQPLAPEGWARKALVKGVGKPITRTVHDYAERLAVHERDHVRQIEQIALC